MRTFSRGYALVLVSAAVLCSAGCLRKDVTHTLYLSPSDLTWSATEKDVRSDDPDPTRRLMEEQDYILSARAGQHPVARALVFLGATRLNTTRLRSERPFTVVTEGHFSDLGELARALLRRAGLRGDAVIERDGCRRTFRAWADTEPEVEGTDDLDALVGDPASYRIVLTEGRFLKADGFTIEEDGAIATPSAGVTSQDGVVKVSLTWIEGWCAVTR